MFHCRQKLFHNFIICLRNILVKYEDLVENDLNVAKMFYNFTGVSFDDSIVDHIEKLSNGSSMKIKGGH